MDGGGQPLQLGDQTLWCVFNDADPSRHVANHGLTQPLGVEVQQTVWAAATATTENEVYVRFKLYNRSGQSISNFCVGLFLDPDIGSGSGGALDDLIGCDTLSDVFFGFNRDAWDVQYGAGPAAVGGRLLSGPVVASWGDTADFEGHQLPHYRNLGMTAFTALRKDYYPGSAAESYRCMRGLALYGGPLPNGTKFDCPGDPISLTGDLDTVRADRYLLVSFGPVPTMAPGDSQQVFFKLGAYAQKNWIYSLAKLKNILDPAWTTYPSFVSCDSAPVWMTHFFDVHFDPEGQRWLDGVDFGLGYFGGGAGFGVELFGSALDPVVDVDTFPSSVQIQFSPTATQKAYSYLRGGSPNYRYNGYYNVPFRVWDTDHGRQLNAAFVEWTGSNVFDSTWDPDNTVNGGREYLFIFNSTYSGDNPYNTPIPYPDKNVATDAGTLDILYCLAPKVRDGHSFSELNSEQSLVFTFQSQIPYGKITSYTFPDTRFGDSTIAKVEMRQFSAGYSLEKLATSNSVFTLSQPIIGFARTNLDTVAITFKPAAPGPYSGSLTVRDSISGAIRTTVTLSGNCYYDGPMWYVAPSGNDANNGSQAAPFKTIQRGLDAAHSRDTVQVEDGTYSGLGNIDMSFMGKNIVLRSHHGAPYATISCTGGQGYSSAFQFVDGEDSASIVQGFTIRDAGTAAVYANLASPTFIDCVFKNNHTSAVDFHQSHSTFIDCQFRYNSCDFCEGEASAVDLYDCHPGPTFLTCTFVENGTAGNSSGASVICRSSSMTARNCTFANNQADDGGVFLDLGVADTVRIENSVVAYNYSGAGITCAGSAGIIVIACTDIFGNTGGDWVGCIESLQGINNNLSINPKFCDIGNHSYFISSSSECSQYNNACHVLIGSEPVGCVTDTAAFTVTKSVPTDLYCVQKADIDGDNYTDLVYVGDYSDGLYIVYGSPGGTFTTPQKLTSMIKADIAVDHADTNSLLDIVAVSNSVMKVLLNNGDRTFTIQTVPLSGGRAAGATGMSADDPVPSIATGFFNDDAYPDIVMAPGKILYGDGNGGFPTSTILGFTFQVVNVADFNRDGKDDLFVVVGDSGKVYLQTGPGVFDRSSAVFVGSPSYYVTPVSALADLNFDGIPDFAMVINMANSPSQSRITWGLGDGAGGFGLVDSIKVPGAAFDLVTADANKDHYLDIAIANGPEAQLQIFFGDGAGHFGNQLNVNLAGAIEITLALASLDVDRDGNADFVSGGAGSGYLTFAVSDANPDPVLPDEMVTTGYGNTSIAVVNPNDYVISRDFKTVAGCDYWRHDANGDGTLDEEAYDFNLMHGEYDIIIDRRPGTDPNAAMTVGIRIDGTEQVKLFLNYLTPSHSMMYDLFSASANTDSIVFHYTVETPSSIQPPNGAPTHGVQPTLDWHLQSSGATNYQVQLDEDYFFGSPRFDDGTLTEPHYHVPSPLGKDSVYYWRYRSYSGGQWSNFSRTFALYIQTGCCAGMRGNTNGDSQDKVNVSDVSYLIGYLFGIPAGLPPPCPEEGNANGDVGEKVNISDVTYLLSYLFGIPSGPPPKPCP